MARPSAREPILESALKLVARRRDVDTPLADVADAAGVTLAGLLYHFPSKQHLHTALLQLIIRRWESEMEMVLESPLSAATTAERILAYATVAGSGHVVPGENVFFADLVHRQPDQALFEEWVDQTFAVPPEISPSQRARLLTAWLAANGLWSTLTARKRPLSPGEVADVLDQITALTASDASDRRSP